MILNSLSKIFAKGTYIKLTLFALILQVVSLFRSYPLNPPCGRVLEITKGVNLGNGYVKRNPPLYSSEVQKNSPKKVPARCCCCTLEEKIKQRLDYFIKKHPKNLTNQIRI
jgi:hypothetical protein